MKKYLFALLSFVMPTRLLRPVGQLFGHSISEGAKIGFSVVCVDRMELGAHARIGHGNIVTTQTLTLSERAMIGHLNRLHGPVHVRLDNEALIGNRNKIYRASQHTFKRMSHVRIGGYSKITSDHLVECLRDVEIGDNTTLGGIGSQLWTHSYYHHPTGRGRFRIDGGITIGNNVYVGSMCVINPGVRICDAVSVGSHSVVARTISEPGLYVSQPLRKLSQTAEGLRSQLIEGDGDLSYEPFFEKPPEKLERKS